MIGVFIPDKARGGEHRDLAHSHKLEMRLGDEVWMTDNGKKHRQLAGKLDNFFL